MAVLRTLIGEALRTTRLRQDRTLREVSAAARVSLGYLSEVERGQKEASSELLASICRALGVRLSDVLREVSESLSAVEPEPVPVPERVEVPAVGLVEPFPMDPATQERFLGGLDDVGTTMRHESAIDEFEATRPGWLAAR